MVQQQLFTADDRQRAATQLKAVRELLGDGGWWTFKQLQVCMRDMGIHATENSISSRIRDLRKEKYGGFTCPKKRIGRGLWAYRLED